MGVMTMKEKLIQIYKMMTAGDATLFIYAFAYSLIVGIAPFLIIAVVFLGSRFTNVDVLIDFLSRYVPADLINPFIGYISNFDIEGQLYLFISILSVSLWVGSKSIYSFILLSSEYDDVKVSHIILRILSLFYFILLIITIMGVGFIATLSGIALRLWILPTMIVFFCIFYLMTSLRVRSFLRVLPGAVIASGLLNVLGMVFFNYVNQFSNYQNIYGPLASVMILMISCWIISWIVFLGYTVNFVLYPTESEATMYGIRFRAPKKD